MKNWNAPISRTPRAEVPRSLSTAEAGALTFEVAVEQWLEEYVSPKTKRPYAETNKRNARDQLLGGPCTEWRAANGIITVADWTDEAAAAYCRWYQKDYGKAATTTRKLRDHLRSFAKFCVKKGYATPGTALYGDAIYGAEDDVADEPALTQAEVAKLLKAASATSSGRHSTSKHGTNARLTPTRDELMVGLLAYTGIRPSELVALEEQHFKLAHTPPTVTIATSGTRPGMTKSAAGVRQIPLTVGQTWLPDLVRRHLADPGRPRGSTHMFLAARRDPVTGARQPLTQEGLKLVLKGLGARTGIKCNAYRFRHSFCTWCANANMPMLNLQLFMGHKDFRMVARYYRGRTDQTVLEAAARLKF